jgi:hypothetical protein
MMEMYGRNFMILDNGSSLHDVLEENKCINFKISGKKA